MLLSWSCRERMKHFHKRDIIMSTFRSNMIASLIRKPPCSPTTTLNNWTESIQYDTIATSRSLCFRLASRAQVRTLGHRHTHPQLRVTQCVFRCRSIPRHAGRFARRLHIKRIVHETCRPNNIDGWRSVTGWRTYHTNERPVRYYRILYANMRFAYYITAVHVICLHIMFGSVLRYLFLRII